MTQPMHPTPQPTDPSELVAQYVASGQPPDGPLGIALFHQPAQPEVRQAFLRFLTPEARAEERAAALAWVGRYQGKRSTLARQLLRAGLTDSAPQVRLAALQYVGDAIADRPDAARIIDQDLLPLTRPEAEPKWRLRMTAWSAVSAALQLDPLSRFMAQGGDPDPRVGEGVRLLSQMRATEASGDMNTAGALAGVWEQLLARSD